MTKTLAYMRALYQRIAETIADADLTSDERVSLSLSLSADTIEQFCDVEDAEVDEVTLAYLMTLAERVGVHVNTETEH